MTREPRGRLNSRNFRRIILKNINENTEKVIKMKYLKFHQTNQQSKRTTKHRTTDDKRRISETRHQKSPRSRRNQQQNTEKSIKALNEVVTHLFNICLA